MVKSTFLAKKLRSVILNSYYQKKKSNNMRSLFTSIFVNNCARERFFMVNIDFRESISDDFVLDMYCQEHFPE